MGTGSWYSHLENHLLLRRQRVNTLGQNTLYGRGDLNHKVGKWVGWALPFANGLASASRLRTSSNRPG